MSTLVTYEKVCAAAQKLQASGQRPTVRLLIATLGGGSPNAVLPLLNQWKAAQSPSAKPELALEPAIAKVIAQQLAVMTAQATAAADAKLAELAADIELLADNGRAVDALNQQLKAELALAQALTQQLSGQLAERSKEMEAIRQESAQRIEALQLAVENERKMARDFRDELMRAQFKLEGLSALQDKVAGLTAQLRASEQALAAANQEAAVTQAKLTAQIERAEEARARELALLNKTA